MNKKAIIHFKELIEKELRDSLGSPEKLKALQDYLRVLEDQQLRYDKEE